MALGLAAVYFMAGRFGLSLKLAHGNATPVWAPTGISLAALVLFGRELWPGVALGALLVNATTNVPVAVALAAAVGNTAAVLIAYSLVERPRPRSFERLSEVVRLVVASLAGPLVSASVGTLSLWATRTIPRPDAAFTWGVWWLGDSLGFLIVAPLLIAWARPSERRAPARPLEALALAVALALVATMAFGPWNRGWFGGHPLAYAVLPLVMWAALRFGQRGATLATFAVAGFSLWAVARGYEPLPRVSQAEELLLWQVFCAVVAVTSVVLAAAAERERAEGSLRFLAEAGEVLGSSLDIQQTLGTVAELASRSLADWAVVDLLDERGELTRVKVTHRDPAKLAAAAELERRYPPDPQAQTGARGVLATGTPLFGSEITEEEIRRSARDEQHYELLSALGLRSYMVVPIEVRGRSVGVMSFLTAESGRRYGPADLALARELARRAGLAIENARLYGQSVAAEHGLRQKSSRLEQDVEARNRELEEQNRQMLEFSYSVSHDLRAPVRAIGGYVDALTEDLHGRVAAHDVNYLERIREATQRMDALIHNLLAYSRLGKEELALEPVALPRVVHDAIAPLELTLADKHAHVQVRLPDGLPEVIGHPVTLAQAIGNLVLNAATFVPPGREPEVTLDAEARNGRVRLWVRDNGIGIDPEHHALVFMPFQRLHSARDYPGTGIGLAMVRRAIERAGGEVGVESSVGEGSRFWIELPAATAGRTLA